MFEQLLKTWDLSVKKPHLKVYNVSNFLWK